MIAEVSNEGHGMVRAPKAKLESLRLHEVIGPAELSAADHPRFVRFTLPRGVGLAGGP
jgi:hypothetical protein